MPTLVNGTMKFTLAEAITPEQLRGYGGEVKLDAEELVTLTFPTMHHAASWAETFGLSNQTWLTGPTHSFGDHVRVDVMHPDA